MRVSYTIYGNRVSAPDVGDSVSYAMSASSSTSAGLRNIQPSTPLVGAQVRGVATHRALGFGSLDQAVKVVTAP